MHINIEKKTRFLYLDPNLNYRVLLDTVHFIVMELRITWGVSSFSSFYFVPIISTHSAFTTYTSSCRARTTIVKHQKTVSMTTVWLFSRLQILRPPATPRWSAAAVRSCVLSVSAMESFSKRPVPGAVSSSHQTGWHVPGTQPLHGQTCRGVNHVFTIFSLLRHCTVFKIK